MSDRLRITGMYSGFDTESIVEQLVASKQTKVDKLKAEQTKISWKQEIWQELNTKVYSLYSTTLSKLRLTGAYTGKKTTCSDTTKATVTADSSVVNGTQTLQIRQLAKAGYLTGAKLDGGTDYTTSSKMSDISSDLVGQTISVTAGGETTDIEITSDMTVSGFVSALKDAGVNASFDAANQRFFISSSDTGSDNEFSITGTNVTATTTEPVLDDNGDPTYDDDGNAITKEVTTDVCSALSLLGLDMDDEQNVADGATRVDAQDAVIYLNGAEFTSSTNTFTVNGLTINALSTTSDDEELTIVTETDVDGIYSTIKDFLTEYNELINSIYALYNADSARDYDVLTSDEKESMTDDEIDKWEQTIKDALLRKDTQLGTLMNTLTGCMLQGYSAGGTTKYLSNYGIKTLGYFSASEDERYAYHIDGDEDDDDTCDEDDLLKAAITSDPEGTAEFFSNLCKNLYESLYSLMGRTDYSSIYKVYNDKKLDSDYDDYTDKIKDAEDALSAYEDKWYDKFASMEKALSKLSSASSVVSSMLGTSS